MQQQFLAGWSQTVMHSGVFSSLGDVLFRRLDDVDDHERKIIEFLTALNDDNFDRVIPAQVPSGLSVGGLIE